MNGPSLEPGVDKGTKTEELRDVVEVDHLEVQLPCRSYRVSYKVAENSEFSLATEFLLRLLRIADGMQEEAIGEFFGFTVDEIRFVIDYIENAGYLHRGGGRVYLSDSGHALFVSGAEPRLFEVNSKQELFDFDLISFTPADSRKSLSKYDLELPELPIEAAQDPGQASKHIVKSFSRYFQEFRNKRGVSRLEKQSLYTVDDIQPELRYSSIIPLKLLVRPDEPGYIETDITDWRTGTELDDRALIVQSCAKFASSIRSRSDELSDDAVQWLTSTAPEQTSRFVKLKNKELDIRAFFRACVRQAGELRIDRPTVRTVGQLWTDDNRIRVASALKYASGRPQMKPLFQVWLRPSVPYWGMTTRVPELLSAVDRQYSKDEENEFVRSVLIGEEHPSQIFRHGFNALLNVLRRNLPLGLEVFLVPRQLCYVAIHTPIGHSEAFPIPLGILSFDVETVARVQHRVSALLSRAYVTQAHSDWECSDIRANLEKDLTTLPS